MKPRLLILGGSHFQLPLIRAAKARGLHVITADYRPDNPGHRLADEYHDVSTTDAEGVLALARRIGIDAVATFASDPALAAVAHTADALGLPGARPAAVERLGDKQAFRELMRGAGLQTPASRVVTAHQARDLAGLAAELTATGLRHIVKPVDSCGSKGVTVLDPGAGGLADAVGQALMHSRRQRCIVEQYIDGPQIHGDGYLQDGRLVHHYMGDHVLYTKMRRRIPISTRWPCQYGAAMQADLAALVEHVCRAAGYSDGPVNIEARVNAADELYLIEVAPRNGGNHVPLIQQHLTGFDFVRHILDRALGLPPTIDTSRLQRRVGAHYVLHADAAGPFQGLRLSAGLRPHLLSLTVFKERGDPIAAYAGSHTTVGVALLTFGDVGERDTFMNGIEHHVQVDVEAECTTRPRDTHP